jgi:hypothetical protein
MALAPEPVVQVLRRAYPEAQALLEAVPSRELEGFYDVGWHDPGTGGENGAVALVRSGGDLEDLVGEIIYVTGPAGSAYAVVYGRGDVVTDLSLSRRLMLDVGYLYAESVSCTVGIV